MVYEEGVGGGRSGEDFCTAMARGRMREGEGYVGRGCEIRFDPGTLIWCENEVWFDDA